MYFLAYIVNFLSWIALGLCIGHRFYELVQRRENSIYLVSGLGGLTGGTLGSLTHGMFPRIGIDLFNLIIAACFSFLALYLFVPETRNKVFVRILRELKTRYKIFYQPDLWRKNITSLISR